MKRLEDRWKLYRDVIKIVIIDFMVFYKKGQEFTMVESLLLQCQIYCNQQIYMEI